MTHPQRSAPVMDAPDYDMDLHAWALDQAERIRGAAMPGLDVANIAEEIESLGRSERREPASRFGVLLAHLLKWAGQPERRGDWTATIREQRRVIAVAPDENPSLRPTVPAIIAKAYVLARMDAGSETGCPLPAFPPACVWAPTDILDEDWLPA